MKLLVVCNWPPGVPLDAELVFDNVDQAQRDNAFLHVYQGDNTTSLSLEYIVMSELIGLDTSLPTARKET